MNKTKSLHIIITFLVLFILMLLFTFLSPKYSYNDYDSYFHIKIGQEILENKTIPHTASDTFPETNLKYLPHEVGFQIIVGFLYNLYGWKGTYILTVICMIALLWGLFKLSQVSREEAGLEKNHPFMFIFIILMFIFIYIGYFKVRPQMLSAPIIVWFFIFLRQYIKEYSYKKSLLLISLSFILANIHTGVWLVIFVFMIMVLIEIVWNKKFSIKYIMTFVGVILAGICNSGGIRNILYILEANKFRWLNTEWQSVDYSKYIFFLILVIFVYSLGENFKHGIFRMIFALGILYLGVSSYKEMLFLFIFITYFVAVAIEKVPMAIKFKEIKYFTNKVIIGFFAIGILLNIIICINDDTKTLTPTLPEKEVDYILKNFESNKQPNILTNYVTSAYVAFRGANILADGRYDPFIQENSKGIHEWTAVEMSAYGFTTDKLLEIIDYSKPDYVIYPIDKEINKNDPDVLYRNKVKEKLGKPVFIGDFGEVYKINKDIKYAE